MKLKETIRVVSRNKLFYILDSNGKIKKFKPWLTCILSFIYDPIMEKSVFPKQFNGDISRHFEILKGEYKDLNRKNILEIATGSGFSASLIDKDNSYTGIDISSGLLKLARKRFIKAGFTDFEFYVADASDLPFSDYYFDIVICDLSLNFLGNIETFVKEIRRVMKKRSAFYCSVPLPERKNPKVVIHGNLSTENELRTCFMEHGFNFIAKPIGRACGKR